MIRLRSVLTPILAASALLGFHMVESRAGLIGDTVRITSDSSFSGDPQFVDVLVVEGAPELPGGFGPQASLSNQVGVDLEAETIRMDLIGYMGVGFTPFQGLRFTGLDSPGEVIVGFTVDSNIGGVSGAFDASAISFTGNALNVDFQNGASQTYVSGDYILVSLRFGPSAAVPEPATFALMGIGALGSLGLVTRRRKTA